MKPEMNVRRTAASAALALLCFLCGQTAPAATLGLSENPLFLLSTVEPNIILTFDDSGSMTWGFMPDSVGWNGSYIEANGGDKRAFCSSHYNKLHYDPTAQYPAGVDVNGNVISTSFTAAWINPYNTSAGTIDLSTSYRPIQSMNSAMTSNNSGAYGSPTPTCGESSLPQAAFYFVFDATNAACDGTDLDDDCYDKVVVGAGEQQKFANWYSFYRIRALAAKTAAGKAFANVTTNVRFAYQRLNSCNTGFGGATSGTCPGTYVQPLTSTVRSAFLNWLYTGPSNGGTPLVPATKRAGEYLKTNGTNSPWAQNPGTSKGTEYTCRQNFHVLFTDGLWNNGIGTPTIGNVDGTGATLPDGRSYSTATSPVYAGSTTGGGSETLADATFEYWSKDQRTDLANDIRPYIINPAGADVASLTTAQYFDPDNDPATWQHLSTFTIGMGVTGNRNPANYFDTTLPATAGDWDELLSGSLAWPAVDAAVDGLADVDDLWHAAVNGRGRYFSAGNPQTLVDSFTQVLNNVTSRIGSASALAVNTGTLNTSTAVYQARFNSATWSGQLLSFKVNSDGSVATTATWDAGEVLNTQHFDSGREITTYSRTSLDGVPFRWTSVDSTTQSLLNTSATGTVDGRGNARLDYLRGQTVNEDGAGNESGSSFKFRARTCYDDVGNAVTCNDDKARLGDIVDSAPTLVGPPNGRYPGASYKSFLTSSGVKDRKKVLYAGANDGMLHAFDSADGKELLAYVPSFVHDKLSGLTYTPFTHKQLVNGELTAGDAEISGAWKTVLVGGLNKGGRGYYALDITRPDQFSESNAANLVLWEFTDTDLGYSYSQPAIAKMANGKWAAIFGSGYNNVSPGSGRAILYVVFIEDGVDGTWSATDFVKIDTGIGTTTTPNGMSSPAVADVDGDFLADFIYVGDQRGNLWRFNVTSTNTSDWKNAGNYGVLFTATDSAGVAQPITTRPSVGLHPDGYVGTLVYFGTGKYLEATDSNISGAQTQSFYGIWDRMDPSEASNLVTRSDLRSQTLSLNSAGIREVTDNTIVWRAGSPAPSPSHLGWRVDLPDPGEKQITDSILREGRMIFTTLIPAVTPCQPGGTGWIMELDARNGGRLDDTFDTNGDGEVDDNDRISSGGKTMGAAGTLQEDGAPAQPVIVYDPTGGSNTPGKPPTEYKLISTFDGSVKSVEESPTRPRGAWRQLK